MADLFAWTGGEDPESEARRLRWFGAGMGMLVAAEFLHRLAKQVQAQGWVGNDFLDLGVVLVALIAMGWTLAVDNDRWPLALLGGTLLFYIGFHFPGYNSHRTLALLCTVPLVVFRWRRRSADAEAAWAAQFLRWLPVIVLVWAGIQKAIYGTYFHADFFVFGLARSGLPAEAMLGLISAPELAAVREGMGPHDVGSYRTGAVPLKVLTNLIWIAEVVLPLGLLWSRTRRWAVGACIVFILAAQLIGRELSFALYVMNLLLLYAPVRYQRRGFFVMLAAQVLRFDILLGVSWVK